MMDALRVCCPNRIGVHSRYSQGQLSLIPMLWMLIPMMKYMADRPSAARLFVSIDIPDQYKRVLAQQADAIQQQKFFDGSWVRPEQYHITLHFLGAQARTNINAIAQALTTISFSPFMLTLGKLAVDSAKKPRLLWAELHSNELSKLARDLMQALAPFADPQENRFHAHITLARIRKIHKLDELSCYLASAASLDDFWMVNSFNLIESESTQQGSVYRLVQQFSATH